MIPSIIEAEDAILGAMISDKENIPEIMDVLSDDCFYDVRNKIIFIIIKKMFLAKIPIDELPIYEECKKGGHDIKLGFISKLQDRYIPKSVIEKCCQDLIRCYKLRFLISLTSEISNGAKEYKTDPDSLLLKLNNSLKNYNIGGIDHSIIKNVVHEYVLEVEENMKHPEINNGLKTGIYKFDEVTGGLKDDDFIIIGARPSMGKTAFMLNIINGCSENNNSPNILVYSLESSKKKLVNRMIGQNARLNTRLISSGKLKHKDQLDKFYGSAGKLSDYDITFLDEPNMKFDKLISSAIYLNSQKKTDLICIDYAQLISIDQTKSKTEALEDMSKGLKGLARTLNCPVIALAQLNRSLESRNNKRPVMSDLKGTGSFEQDADIILFIYRDIVYNPKTDHPDTAEIIIGKSRDSETGMFRQKFIPEYTLFEGYNGY